MLKTEVVPRKKLLAWRLGSATMIVIMTAMLILLSIWDHQGSMQEVARSEKVSVDVTGTLDVKGEPYAEFNLGSYHGALSLDELGAEGNPQQITLWKTVIPAGAELNKAAIHQDGNTAWSTQAASALVIADTMYSKTIIATLLMLTLSLLIPQLGMIFDRTLGENMPPSSDRVVRAGEEMELSYEEVTTILFVGIGPLVALVGSLMPVYYLVFRAWGFDNIPAGLGGLITSCLVAVVVFKLGNGRRASNWAGARAARIIWGEASGLPCQTVKALRRTRTFDNPELLTDWPLDWVKEQGVDLETLDGLGGLDYEGTLGELVAAAKELGPE